MVQYWAVVIVLVIVMIAIAASTGNKHSPKSGSTATPSNTGTTGSTASSGSTGNTGAAPTAVPTTTTVEAPQILQSQNGSGIKSLPRFTVPSSDKGWQIQYLYNCSNFEQSGYFAISVQDSTGQPVDVAANVLGISGGSTYYNDAPGRYQLEVNSGCDWSVVVQTMPR